MFFWDRIILLNISDIIKEFQKILFILLPFFVFTGPFLADISITIIGIIFFYFFFKEKLYQKKINKIIYIFLIFWLFLIISSFNSNYFIESFSSSFPYIRFLFFVLGGIYVINKFKDSVKLFSLCLLFTYLLALTDGYIQYFFDQGITGLSYNRSRLSLPFNGELVMGSFLSRLFPLMLMFNLFFYRNNKFMIYIVSIIFILVDVLIFLSGERAAFFYLIFSTILILLMLNKYKVLRFVTFIISLVIITLISISDNKIKNRMFDQTIQDFQTKNLGLLNNNSDLDKGERSIVSFFNKYNAFTKAHTALYSSSLNILIDNNVLYGIGPNTFRYYCDADKYISNYGIDSCSTHPHNTYVQLLTESGIFGFGIVFLFFLIVLFRIVKHIFINLYQKKLDLNYFQIGSYVAILISLWPFVPTGSFFNNWLSIIYFIPVIFIFTKDDLRYE